MNIMVWSITMTLMLVLSYLLIKTVMHLRIIAKLRIIEETKDLGFDDVYVDELRQSVSLSIAKLSHGSLLEACFFLLSAVNTAYLLSLPQLLLTIYRDAPNTQTFLLVMVQLLCALTISASLFLWTLCSLRTKRKIPKEVNRYTRTLSFGDKSDIKPRT